MSVLLLPSNILTPAVSNQGLPTPSQPEPPPRGSAGHRVRESRYFFFAFFAAFFFAAMLVLTPLLRHQLPSLPSLQKGKLGILLTSEAHELFD